MAAVIQQDLLQHSHYIGYKRAAPLMSTSEDNAVYATKHFKEFVHERTVEDSRVCAIISKENVTVINDAVESITVEQNAGFVELHSEDEFTEMLKNVVKSEIEVLNVRIQDADRRIVESEKIIEDVDIRKQEAENKFKESEYRNKLFIGENKELNSVIQDLQQRMFQLENSSSMQNMQNIHSQKRIFSLETKYSSLLSAFDHNAKLLNPGLKAIRPHRSRSPISKNIIK
jgi:hypothetical protein